MQFNAKILKPKVTSSDQHWAFLIFPKSASEQLPRRGRTSVEGTINGYPFFATLEPDGQLSHWMKLDKSLLDAAALSIGDTVSVEAFAVTHEPEPTLPDDFANALKHSPQATATWDSATTLARVDWIHWIESAKQAKTRQGRIDVALSKLNEGKKTVCCFDNSGFYSKSLSAPKTAR